MHVLHLPAHPFHPLSHPSPHRLHAHAQDPALVRNGRFDMLSVKSMKEIRRIILLGYRFAQRRHEEGAFERFDLEGITRH